MKTWEKRFFSLIVAILAIFTVVFMGCPTNVGGTNLGGTISGTTNSGGTNSGGTNLGGTNLGGTDSGGTNSGTDSGGTNLGGTDSGGNNSGTDSGGTNSGATKYEIGDTGPGGGKIFYYSEAGFTMTDNNQLCHYLEAAPENMSDKLPWNAQGTSAVNTGEAIGTGRKNTANSISISSHHRAATACRDYRGPNNLTDWFLPSKDELNELYKNRVSLDVPDSLTRYWSSSGGIVTQAWSQSFLRGQGESSSQSTSFKNLQLLVRAVRAF